MSFVLAREVSSPSLASSCASIPQQSLQPTVQMPQTVFVLLTTIYLG